MVNRVSRERASLQAINTEALDTAGIVGLWCSKGPEEAQQMATRIRS